jgi:putative oxidoreductase
MLVAILPPSYPIVGCGISLRNKAVGRLVVTKSGAVHCRRIEPGMLPMTMQTSSHPALSGADSVAAVTSDFVMLCGRILLGWIFIRSGYGKLFDIAGVGATFPARGIPAWMAYISVPAEFFGGLAILFGFATRYAAVVMILFTLVATFSSHRYWDVTDAAAHRAQESNFYKNMAILGGIFFLFAVGAGRLSIDRMLGRDS